MSERFTILPMLVMDGDVIMTADLRLLLFQVEGYMPIDVQRVDDDQRIVMEEGVRVYTKGGGVYDIMMTTEDFDKLFK